MILIIIIDFINSKIVLKIIFFRTTITFNRNVRFRVNFSTLYLTLEIPHVTLQCNSVCDSKYIK